MLFRKSLKGLKSSNLGTKSLKVRALRKTQGMDWKNFCVCILSAVTTRCKRKTHVNRPKKCVCMCSSALVSTQCKRKKTRQWTEKCVIVRINFHVVESSTLLLWSIQTESNYPVQISILDLDSLGSESFWIRYS